VSSHVLRFSAVARGDWYEAVGRVRAAIAECGFVLGERPFSGVLVSFEFELEASLAGRFGASLFDRGVRLDDASAQALANAIAACAGDALLGMLSVSFPGGDPDKHLPIPAVPG